MSIETDTINRSLQAIGMYIKNEKSLDILEKNIRKISSDNEEYIRIVYDVLVLIREKEPLTNILKMVKENKIGLNSSKFEAIYEEVAEKDNFLDNPFSVEEGVLECGKCGSKRTFSYSKQVRRSDEGFTTFCLCSNCGARWRIN
jgi:DNA-directed RNA polymerase subunit M/transcription elongation factor TFIIS